MPSANTTTYTDTLYSHTSCYVIGDKGVLLAVDIYRPNASAPLSTIMMHTRYMRAWVFSDGRRRRLLETLGDGEILASLVQRGYIVVVADARGTGASFGGDIGAYSAEDARDIVRLIDWITEQNWSDGKVGLFGRSASGMTACLAASENPPALKAIATCMHGYDARLSFWPGGLMTPVIGRYWPMSGAANFGKDPRGCLPAPVDDDVNGAERDLAIEAHVEAGSGTERLVRLIEGAPGTHGFAFSDEEYFTQDRDFGPVNLSQRTKKIKAAAIPYCHFSGWGDAFCSEAMMMYSMGLAQSLTIGPWPHHPDPRNAEGRAYVEAVSQQLDQWFGYHLRGEADAAGEIPALRVAILDNQKWRWVAADSWANLAPDLKRFDLEPSRKGLKKAKRIRLNWSDATSGEANLIHHLAKGVPIAHRSITNRAKEGLRFETVPLTETFESVSSPVIELNMEADKLPSSIFANLYARSEEGGETWLASGGRLLNKDGVMRISLSPFGRRLYAGTVLLILLTTQDTDTFSPGVKASSFSLSPGISLELHAI